MTKYNIALKIIKLLSDGCFYTYNDIYQNIGITKKKIDIEINYLKILGLNFSKSFVKGLKLDKPIQLIDKKKISLQLLKNNKIFIIPIIDSTSVFLINRIDTLKSGDICVSEYQKKGRGRNGKNWFSPFGYNLYFSMYWNLLTKNNSIDGLSILVAISIAESLKKLGAEHVQIKWPNDIYLYNKKLAGILIDIIHIDKNKTKIVIGIGINLLMNFSFCKIKKNNYISLQETSVKIDRNFIFSFLIKNLKLYLSKFESKGLQCFIPSFLKLGIYLNKPIDLILKDRKISGIYRGIDFKGSLILEKNNFFTYWNFGNVSMRAKYSE